MSKPWITRPVVLLGIAFNAIYLAYWVSGRAPEVDVATAVPRPALTLKAPGRQSSAVVSFRAGESSQTNVYPAEDLLLLNEEGRRLQFAPLHTFSDASQGIVDLRFYAFSREPQYASGRRLRVVVDGDEIWASEEALYSLTEEDGEVVESLGARMRFEDFVRAVNGQVVRITVGREEFVLLPEQVSTLRRMASCALGGACG